MRSIDKRGKTFYIYMMSKCAIAVLSIYLFVANCTLICAAGERAGKWFNLSAGVSGHCGAVKRDSAGKHCSGAEKNQDTCCSRIQNLPSIHSAPQTLIRPVLLRSSQLFNEFCAISTMPTADFQIIASVSDPPVPSAQLFRAALPTSRAPPGSFNI